MKKLFVVVFLLALVSFQAKADDEAKVFKCVRKAIKIQKLNEVNAKSLVEVLRGIKNNEDSAVLLQKCKDAKSVSKFNFKKSKAELLLMFNNLQTTGEISSAEYQVLKGFVYPDYHCQFGDISVGASVVIGGVVGIGAGSCTGDNGKVKALVIPKVGYSVGFFGGVIVNQSKFTIRSSELIYDAKDDIYFGLIVAVATTGGLKFDYAGSGIGLGVQGNDSVQVPIRLITYKNDFSRIRDTLSIQ